MYQRYNFGFYFKCKYLFFEKMFKKWNFWELGKDYSL